MRKVSLRRFSTDSFSFEEVSCETQQFKCSRLLFMAAMISSSITMRGLITMFSEHFIPNFIYSNAAPI
jgi:hypothetical protein